MLCILTYTVNAQDAPNGYTTNYNFKKWSQGSSPSADSLNHNTTLIDARIKIEDLRIDSLRSRTINGYPLSANVTLTKADLQIDTTNYLNATNINAGTLSVSRLPSAVYTTSTLDTSTIPFQNTRNVYTKPNLYNDSLIATSAVKFTNLTVTSTITANSFLDAGTGTSLAITGGENNWNGTNIFSDNNSANIFEGLHIGDGSQLTGLATSALVGVIDISNIPSTVYKTTNFDTSKVVTTDQVETITGQKNFSKISTKALWSTVTAVTTDIDWAESNTFSKTLSADVTVTFSNTQAGQMITVVITGDASHTVTWPTVTWQNSATQPTQTLSKTDIYSFIKIGSTIYGTVAQNF